MKEVEKLKPYSESSEEKKIQIEQMFDNIAVKYDFLNHLLSAGIDILWRKRAIKELQSLAPKTIMDMATGTGDFAFEALALNPDKIIGIDLSQNMLDVGIEKSRLKNITDKIDFVKGDAEHLNYANDYFDAITVGFGVRNFQNLQAGLTELHRVLKIGGRIAILEPSFPKNPLIKYLFIFHFKYVTPFIGKLFSKDDSAYKYLPSSVEAFPQGETFNQLMREVGYINTKCIPLTFGICTLYLAEKS